MLCFSYPFIYQTLCSSSSSSFLQCKPTMYERDRPTTIFPQRGKVPSFSSSLLDAIYRSIDEPCRKDRVPGLEADSPKMRKQRSYGFGEKQGRHFTSCNSYSSSSSSRLQGAILIEEWMEKRAALNGGRFSLKSASISSSDSTFSSSSDKQRSRRSFKPAPEKQSGSGKSFYFRTVGKLETPRKKIHHGDDEESKSVFSVGFTKTKLRAMKIYGELKSLKQPISPGGRISSFLNSIFNSGKVKKAQMCDVGAVHNASFERKSKPDYSSASRRSCMIKTSQTLPSTSSSSPSPSFSGRNKMKGSVRFYPVSAIVREDSSPCGRITIYENDGRYIPAPTSRSLHDSIKSLSSTAAARVRGFKHAPLEECGEEEDEDAQSCASSDLFELDHLIGVGRYRDELPVYKTTSLKRNQVIAIA
ncbi:hypothetical protein SAY87_025861 [Trapa incisa]|uniref:Protein BIG GRAIN 1-like B n=1 Tax=Trapa incisa TaxID=236973 RepID=A0AAN7GR57_9MYRT|nr:hypothetical protein SAY87_025861 [Trapa incisa]